MHIPPGQWYQTSDRAYWKDQYMQTYLEIFAKYQQRIIMVLGAHAHPGEIRAPLSERYPELNLTILMTPCVAPLGLLNPGYTVIDLPKSPLT